VVGGGLNNQAGDNAGSIADRQFATVSGGRNNNAGGLDATVGGGGFNTASGGAATVPGGALNAAAGQFTFAAGFRAKANHVGSFVWGDSTNADIASSTFNQFTVRASGGVRFFSNGAATAGVVLPPGGGGWLAVSDRNLKENLQAVDGAELLERLGRIPIQSWNYQTQENSIRHIGPMAQDFYGAFGVGEDDRYINSVDADGVALAAAQQLYRLTQQKDVEIRELTRHLDDVMKQMQELQARMARLEAE
jgi:hypothetical protein